MLSLDQVRARYLAFARQHGHVIIPSASLLPENDATTLFVSSGMQPLLPYFLGEKHPLGTRLANAQKCFRSQDIEDVGDNRHTTFFEMLGNWSFGDYFKAEQLTWLWQFLTVELGLEPSRLVVSVFAGSEEPAVARDEESLALWQTLFREAGLSPQVSERPTETGLAGCQIALYTWKNWWSRSGSPLAMPLGEPGGPDSEVFYDFGADWGFHERSPWASEACHPNCDCGRYLEIGNSVFIQFRKSTQGLTELPEKCVDFGGGLERLQAVTGHQPDLFRLPLFVDLIARLERETGLAYDQDESARRSYRVIADHLRSAIMLLADGAVPANKEAGYLVRRLIRRAVRFNYRLGLIKPILASLVPLVISAYEQAYPELAARQATITALLAEEEAKFARSLIRGERQLERLLAQRPSSASGSARASVTPAEAFNLYESFGFPLELTVEAVRERIPDDEVIGSPAFEAAFSAIREEKARASRTHSAGVFKGGLGAETAQTTRFHTATHLLQAALRLEFGTSVEQKGSHITSERLRFDFSHPRALSEAELAKIEHQLNAWVAADWPVERVELPKVEALAQGALALFAEKYPAVVSVYRIGQPGAWLSQEFCGGPHVKRTGEIGELKILKEQAVAAGVRRIYIGFS